MGSVYGGLLSILVCIFSLLLLGLLVMDMYGGKNDIIQRNVIPNPMTEDNQIFIGKSSFMPSMQLRLMDKRKETFEALVAQGILRQVDKEQINYSNLYIEWEELSKYISVQIRMYQRSEKGSKVVRNVMRPCTYEDFESRGAKMTQVFRDTVGQRLCPDIEKDDKFYQVRNAYSNSTLRNSFSVEIMKCSTSISETCKDDTEI